MSRDIRRSVIRMVAAAAVMVCTVACAHKDLLPSAAITPRHIALQLTTTASAQQLATPSWVLVLAAYNDGDDFVALSTRFAPLVQGTQQLELAVDLGPCLSYNASRGKDGCSLYIGAALLADTMALADSTRSILNEAFDTALPIGPFEVAPGRVPTIPAIDLSMSRFGTVLWSGDDALRAGGRDTPSDAIGGVLGELAPVSGVANGAAAPILFAPARGIAYTFNDSPAQYVQLPQLAIFENGTWRRISGPNAALVGNTNEYNGVTAISRTEAYLSSTTGLWKYDGTAITRLSAVTDPLASVASTVVGGNTYVIAGSMNGSVWIGNGQTFTRYTVPLQGALNGVCITGATEAFASGTAAGGPIFRFDGTNWTSVPAPSTSPKYNLQCPAPGQAFILASGNQGYSWNGSTWVLLPTTGLTGPGTTRWAVVSPNEIYAYRDSVNVSRVYYRFNGNSWSTVGRTRAPGLGGSRPWAVPTGGAAYVFGQGGRLERITPSGASVVSYQPSLRDVHVNSATSAFIVGAQSFLARWTGGQWTIDAPPDGTPTNRTLQGVWSDGPGNAWAVGDNSTMLRWTGSSWVSVSDSLRPIGTRDDYTAVWGSGTNVWAVGENSILHCTSTAACANESSAGSGGLLDVWGASTSNVISVGDGGRIVRYNGTAWSAMTSPTTRTLARVSGTSASDIWALGDSVLVHYDGTQWSSIPMTGDLRRMQSHVPTLVERNSANQFKQPFGLALFARTPREVYIGNQFGWMYRYDGVGWVEINGDRYRHRFVSMHGTATCALAVTEGQYLGQGSTLWRGVGPTGCFGAPMPAVTSWP